MKLHRVSSIPENTQQLYVRCPSFGIYDFILF